MHAKPPLARAAVAPAVAPAAVARRQVGKIDPSTSTVLIGMLLGNTFGFLLDTMLGSDEGLREYLWATTSGMKYALGSLATAKFGRNIVTILL